MHEACLLCGLLCEKPGNASRKKDFRFPTKEQTGFQIEKAEQCSALETERRRLGTPTPSRIFKNDIITGYFYNSIQDKMTNLRDTCWTWGFLRSPVSLCSVVQKGLDFISLVAEETIFIKLYLITVIWNKCGWTDWSFQATVTGPHLWDNIQTAISPGALL